MMLLRLKFFLENKWKNSFIHIYRNKKNKKIKNVRFSDSYKKNLYSIL